MTFFNDDQQNKITSSLREKEEEELVKTLAVTQYHIPYIDLTKVMIENIALSVVPESFAKLYGLAPFALKGKEISIGFQSPSRKEVLEFVTNLESKGYSVDKYMVSSTSIKKVLDRYKEISIAEKIKAGSLDISPETLVEKINQIKTIQDIELEIEKTAKSSQTHRITNILEVIFAGAIALGVSDVHIEPEEENTTIRFRLDGVLHNVISIDYQPVCLMVD